MSSDDEIREDDDEEVIEVITHEDDADGGGTLGTPSRGVDIIGERPVRRPPPTQSPGCLYSFLLFLVGIGVGWVAFYTYSAPTASREESEAAALQDQIARTKAELNDLASKDIAAAWAFAEKRNYGDACDTLERVASYYVIQKRLTPGVTVPAADAVRDILEKMRSDDPAVQAEGRKLLKDYALEVAGDEVAASESAAAEDKTAESAAPESGESAPAEPAAKDKDAPESGATGESAATSKPESESVATAAVPADAKPTAAPGAPEGTA